MLFEKIVTGEEEKVSLFDDGFYSTKIPKKRRVFRPGGSVSIYVIVFAALILCAVSVSSFLGTITYMHLSANNAPSTVTVEFVGGSGAQERVVAAVDRVYPAVVGIVSTLAEQENGGGWSEEGWGASYNIGSGIIFQKNGDKALVVTNHHVVRDARHFEITLSDGSKREAEIVGQDLLSDLAVLEIDAAGIETVAEFGDSDVLKIGQTAIAIGNPLGLGVSQTVTVGVISSPLRTVPVSLSGGGVYDWELEVLQTDAAINHGSSGGALVNLEGKVIGINSLKVAQYGVEGMGFAIPVNAAKPVIASLMEHGKVLRPYMGVYMHDLKWYEEREELGLPARVTEGVVVMDAVGPAKEAGLQAQDVIVALDGQEVDSVLALRKYLYKHKQIGETLLVTYYRGGQKQETSLILAEAED
jgi:serine protease Do